jgi:hypothetical protein
LKFSSPSALLSNALQNHQLQVKPTIKALDPTAISIGIPNNNNTIKGTFKIPPPTPTRPLLNPAAKETGKASNKLTE